MNPMNLTLTITATQFFQVSHFWGEPHRRFVRSLRLHEMVFELQANYGKTKYWVCAYANNQHEVQPACTNYIWTLASLSPLSLTRTLTVIVTLTLTR